MLTDEPYLASIIDHLDKKYFTNKSIGSVVSIITDYYDKRNTIPTLSEIKSYLTSDELKTQFKQVVQLFEGIDQKFNKDELYDNTEKFLKEKAVYNTLLEVADESVSYTHLTLPTKRIV